MPPRFDEFWEDGELDPADHAVAMAAPIRAFRARPRWRAAADAERQDRDLIADDRRLRLCRLPRPSRLDAASRGRRVARRRAFPAATGRQPAGDAAAQPARFRRHQPRRRKCTGASRCASIPPTPRRAAFADGDIVRLYNDRGACLAGAVLSDALRRGVVQLATGAWYDPEDPAAPSAVLRARQSERADARRRHLARWRRAAPAS